MIRPPRPTVLLLLGLSLLLLAAGCSRIAKPKGFASPVSDGQTVFAAHKKNLYALDPATLNPIWAFPGNEDVDNPVALYGTPAIDGDTVFVPTYDGKLYALSVESGAPIWQIPFETDGPLVGGVAVANGTVYFGSSDGGVYAVDEATGTERWPRFKTDDQVWSTPVVVGDTLYVTSLDSHFYALDATTGEELWSYKTAAGVASTPVIDATQGLAYIAGLDSRVRAIDLDTHEQVWEISADNWFWSQPLLLDGIIYAASLDSHVYAVSALTSETQWDEPFKAGNEIKAAPVAIGDKLFVADRHGDVYGIDLATGRDAFDGPYELGSSVLADPIVLEWNDAPAVGVVTNGGDLFVLDPNTLEPLRQVRLTGG